MQRCPVEIRLKKRVDRAIVLNGAIQNISVDDFTSRLSYDPQTALPALTFVFTFMLASPFFDLTSLSDTPTKAIGLPL